MASYSGSARKGDPQVSPWRLGRALRDRIGQGREIDAGQIIDCKTIMLQHLKLKGLMRAQKTKLVETSSRPNRKPPGQGPGMIVLVSDRSAPGRSLAGEGLAQVVP
jgi:hypothetical protein